MHDPKFLKDRLSWVFERRGSEGQFTRLFDDLGPADKDALAAAVHIGVDELPVLGSFEADDRWLLLTTERIVWSVGGERHQLYNSEISDAIVDFHAMLEHGTEKSDVNELEIETLGGERHVIVVEPGPPMVGLWNVLKNLGQRARAQNDRKV